ncbi:MAG: MFS transporter [Polyangiaceae bacterium]|nr:MFS transporter [Polyangiaceae bacterium]MCW5791055.1 MFS transporter [Polyangiaceae bacterium]
MALTQILPELREEMGVSRTGAGVLVGVVNAGTVVAYLLVRGADRWGRRRVLTWTIAGYTIFTFLTAFAPNVYVFALLQFIARVFLIGEWAVSMVIAAEEFPAKFRGVVIGVLQAFTSLGAIACAGVVPVLLRTEHTWRTVYFVGIIPLIILAFARRGLKETRRFEASREERRAEGKRSFFHIWGTPHRKRMLRLSLIWFLAYICTQNGITFWKEFVIAERAWDAADVGKAITLAALVSMPMVFGAGVLLDVIGRRAGGAVIFVLGAVGVYGCYTLEGFWPLTLCLILGIFGASAVPPVLNAFTTELFPTTLRGDAFAWSNNLLGRLGYVLSPFVVGAAAERVGWGPAVSATAAFQLAALVLIFLWLPETKGRELEETARTT